MKKRYLQPLTAVELIVAERMIASSDTVPIDPETIVNPSDADSRLFDAFGLPFSLIE